MVNDAFWENLSGFVEDGEKVHELNLDDIRVFDMLDATIYKHQERSFEGYGDTTLTIICHRAQKSVSMQHFAFTLFDCMLEEGGGTNLVRFFFFFFFFIC